MADKSETLNKISFTFKGKSGFSNFTFYIKDPITPADGVTMADYKQHIRELRNYEVANSIFENIVEDSDTALSKAYLDYGNKTTFDI